MRIPWLKNQQAKTRIGVFVSKQRIDICVLSANKAAILLLDSTPLKEITELGTVFGAQLRKHALADCECYFVLSNQFYNLLQIDKPKVPDDEITSTLPFIAKEYINEPIDSVVFDYFAVPNQNKINLVYCAKTIVELIVTATQQAKAELINIGIEELSTANLFDSSGLPGDDLSSTSSSTQMLISQQDFQEVTLTIIHDNKLYFSRRLRGFSRLRELQETQLDSALLDNFSLEIQRSADFVVSQLKIPEVKKINLALPSAILEQLIERLQLNFTIPLAPLQHDYLADDIDTNFLPAIGGALEGL
jgi:MSHA biogenesis protein MshI